MKLRGSSIPAEVFLELSIDLRLMIAGVQKGVIDLGKCEMGEASGQLLRYHALMDRFGRGWVIVPGFTVYALSVILMSLTAFCSLPVTFFLVTYVLVLATQGTIGGVMQVLGSDLAPPFARGRFFAIWRTVAQLGA